MRINICTCPSCGSIARLREKNRTVIHGEQTRNCYVYCTECDFRGPRVLYSDYPTTQDAHQAAIAKWNRRVG